jgi:hypothetical protein
MTGLAVVLAVAVGAGFLVLARRPLPLGPRPTRRRRLAFTALRLLYMFSGLSLIIRAIFALSATLGT